MRKWAVPWGAATMFAALLGMTAVAKYVVLHANMLDFGVSQFNFSPLPNSASGNVL